MWRTPAYRLHRLNYEIALVQYGLVSSRISPLLKVPVVFLGVLMLWSVYLVLYVPLALFTAMAFLFKNIGILRDRSP